MPLLDHFHPPLSVRRHWESLHTTWAVCLADALTAQLPEGYFVEVQTHSGALAQIDVATFEEVSSPGAAADGTATATATAWTLPAAEMTMPAVFPEGFEVRVLSAREGPTLVAAVELISPGNKDRPESRRAFATKCASYLYQGISCVIVDVVTVRTANLHNEILGVMESAEDYRLAPEVTLYAVAYRPVRRDDREEIDLWRTALRVGDPMPVIPLVVGNGLALPVDLETTYVDACRRRRLA